MDNTAKHAQAAAICVELALGAVADDIRRELESSSGQTAEVLRRLIVRVQDRQRLVTEYSGAKAA